METIYTHETSNLPTQTVQLKSKSTGLPINITSKTVSFEMYGISAVSGERELLHTVPCVIADAVNGICQFSFTDDAVSEDGSFDGYIIVDGGASQRHVFPSIGSVKIVLGNL